MKGFGLPGAALVCVFAFSLATTALAGGFAGSVRAAHAPGVARVPHKLSPSRHDERAGQSEFGLGLLGYGTSDTESDAAPSPIPVPVPVPVPIYYPLPGYAPPLQVAESHGPRIIYIGHDEARPSPVAGPKIIYGDEEASTNGDATVIRGDQ